MFGTTQSGKIYRSGGSEELETSPLILPSWESKEELMKVSWRSVVSLIRQRIPHLPPPPTPPPISPSSPPSLPNPPPPPPQFSMVSAIKLPVFRGVGNEDLYQFWFVVWAVWEAQGVMDDNIKKATLVSALHDCTLKWYVKHSNDYPNVRIIEI